MASFSVTTIDMLQQTWHSNHSLMNEFGGPTSIATMVDAATVAAKIGPPNSLQLQSVAFMPVGLYPVFGGFQK